METLYLSFNVKGQFLTRTDSYPVYSGSINFVGAKFIFDWHWNDTNRYAQFVVGENTYTKDIINGVCSVPWECFANAGTFTVTVFGGTLITANAVTVTVLQSAIQPDQLPNEPTPGFFDEVVTMVNEAKADTIFAAGGAEADRILAETAKNEARKWADGTGATEDDPQFDNHSKYHAEESKAWAIGTADPEKEQHNNSAKDHAMAAKASEDMAKAHAEDAEEFAEDAEEAAQTATEQANRAQGIADEFENETLPAAITAVEAAGQAKVDLFENETLPAAITAVEAAGQAKVDLFENETLPAAITAVEAAGQAKVDLAEQQANIAAGHAQTAATKAEETSGYVSDAFEYKEAAEGAASIATEKAWEAANSAQIAEQQAGIAATKATEAYDSAERAKMSEEAVEGVADEHRLKIAKLEKELNDYKATLAGMNPNQEAKQKVNGYGIISLPKNAAQSGVQVALLGQTLKNEIDYDPDTWGEWGGNIASRDGTGMTMVVTGTPVYSSVQTNFKPSTKYGFLMEVVENTLNVGVTSISTVFFQNICPAGFTGIVKVVSPSYASISSNSYGFVISGTNPTGTFKVRNVRAFELPVGSSIEWDFENLSAEELDARYPFFRGTRSAVAPRLRSVDKNGENPTYLYTEPLFLRGLPNNVRDELTPNKYTQNVKEYALQSSDITQVGNLTNVSYVLIAKPTDAKTYNNTTSYATDANVYLEGFTPSTFADDATKTYIMYNSATTSIGLIVPKGIYANLTEARVALTGKRLYYQLATPITFSVDVSGTLTAYPSGTIYAEPALADAGVYDGGITVFRSDFPIETLETVERVDYATGHSTPLDVSDAVISPDGKSFTHPALIDGDIVFFTYYHAVEGIQPEIDVEYYDSRYVIKDSVTGKFYKWHIAVSEGVPSIELVEV